MVDWPTVASLATAAGTLVLAAATFAAVRSANRAARTAERSLEAGLRPLILPTRHGEAPQKISWQDRHRVMLGGGQAAAEIDGDVIYLAATIRNAGAGIAVLHSWYPIVEGTAREEPADLAEFRRLTRDLYIPAHDSGFWQGAVREPADPFRERLTQAIKNRDLILIDLLYGDHEGGQRTITRLALWPLDSGAWMTTVSRYWHVDGHEPR
jgi:hypothetical protein